MPDTATDQQIDFQPEAIDFQPEASAPPMPSVRDVMKMSQPWTTRASASADIDRATSLPASPALPAAQNRLSIAPPHQGTATQEVERQAGPPLTLQPTAKATPLSPPPAAQNQITPVPRPALGQPTLPAPQSTEPKQNVTLVSTGFGTPTWIANDQSIEARQEAARLNAAEGEAVRGVTGVAGYPRIAAGAKTLVPTSTQPYPSAREVMSAGAEVLGGLGEAARPAMIAGAPLVNTPALIGMTAGGAAADIGAKAIADKVHASPEAKALIGEAATLVGGFAGGVAGGGLYMAAKDFSPIEDSLTKLLFTRGFVNVKDQQIPIQSEMQARAVAQSILKKNPVSLREAISIWRESRSQQPSERIPTGDVEYVGPKVPRTPPQLTGQAEPTRAEIAEAMEATNFAGPEAYKAHVAASREAAAQAVPASPSVPSARAGQEGAPAQAETAPPVISSEVQPSARPAVGPRAIQPQPAVAPAAQSAAAQTIDFEPEKPSNEVVSKTAEEKVQPGGADRPTPAPAGASVETRGPAAVGHEPATGVVPPSGRVDEGLRETGAAKGRAGEVAQPEKPFKYRSTQANIPEGSEAHQALELARGRIDDTDLAGKGKDVGGNHLTVKYGLKAADDDELTKLKQYLASLSPFEATLGKTEKFDPTEHSEGAAVIQAPIEAKELHQINQELDQHGDFKESDFGEYKPHATIAYVKPEAAGRYVGMNVTAGKKFTVNEIAITDREGKQETVRLEGKADQKVQKGTNVDQKVQTDQAIDFQPETIEAKSDTKAAPRETAIEKVKTLTLAGKHDEALKVIPETHAHHEEPAAIRGKETHEVYRKDGAWTPEREKLHAKNVAAVVDDKPRQEKPALVILGGGAASGKSAVTKQALKDFPDAVVIDPDHFKELTAEYHTFKKTDPFQAAHRVHEESSLQAAQVLKAATGKNNHIILDGVNGKADKVKRIIAEAKAEGYRIDVRYIDRDKGDALKGMVSRFDKTGRWVPGKVFEDGHHAAAATFHEIKDLADNATLHVVDGKGVPQLVYENGKVYDQAALEKHQNKGKEHGRNGVQRRGDEADLRGSQGRDEAPEGGRTGPAPTRPEELSARPEKPAQTGRLEDNRNPVAGSRVAQLIDRFEEAIKSARLPTDAKELRELARETVGGNPSEYIDDIYDAIEGATNRFLRGEWEDLSLYDRIKKAEAVENKIGKRIRSLEITALQQFSTPHTISEAAAYAADVQPGERVLEPTAGTGNLIEPVRGAAKEIFPVELDPRRVEVLRANGYKPVQGDFLRTPTPKPTQIAITNPPWGKISTGRYKALDVPAPWGKFGDVSERFFVKAFNDLAPGGRISAVMPTTIMGIPARVGGRVVTTPKSLGFMNWITKNGTLRAIIQSPPGAYDNRGTSVNSLLIVVDKGKIADAPAPIMRIESEQPQDWDQYAKAVEPLAEGGTHARNAVAARAETLPGDRDVARPESPAPGTRPERVPAERGPRQGALDVRPESVGMGASLVPGAHVHESVDSPGADGASLPEPTTELVRKSPGTLRGDLAAKRLAEFKEANDSPVFAPYAVRSGISGNPHPRQVVETRSLAGAPAPKVTYKPSKGVLDAHKRGALSDEQFDIAAIAGQANDNGHALMVADDVGVGKSREIAAIAIDILEKGKGKRGLFTSKSEVNLRDLERQMKIVAGVDPNSGELPFKYIYLRDFKNASERANKKTEYQPVPAYDNAVYVVESTNLTPYGRAIQELQPDFVLADEVHTYKNDDAGIGKTWKALHRDWLSRKVPISYFSATPATTLDELEYLYGLREWPLDGFADWVARKTGHGTPEQEKKARERSAKLAKGENVDIEDQVGSDASEISKAGMIAQLKQALDNAVKNGDAEAQANIRSQLAKAEKDQKNKKWGQQGHDVFHVTVSTAEMEQIMRELKMKGKYIARDLWRGGVEFQEKEMPLSKAENESWTHAIRYMRDVEKAFNLFANENETMRKGFGITAFLQAAAKRKLFDMRLERAIAEAHESLKRGEQPVISTINVNETKEGEGYLAAALRSINVSKIIQDSDTGEVTDLGEIPEAVAVKGELTERAAKEFPPSPDPIATIQKAFGKDKVAIITGAESPKMRLKMKQEFQSGAKQVAVISGAGKTGISLHHVAETAGPAKGRRHMIEADYEWSATTFKQELGRVDRAGQLTPPKITALTLGSAAERKFISTIANRMKSLGAVSKGAAESTGTGALDQFELGGDVDNMVLRDMWKTMDKPLKEWFRGRKFMDVGTDGEARPKNSIEGATLKDFLLQLQLMPIDVGNQVWNHFWKTREETYGSESVAEALARKTQKFSGDVLRSVQLKPDLSMYEVKDAAGHRSAILAGMVTEYMPLIQQYLESGRERNAATGMELIRKQREYITFQGNKGEQISGLKIRPSAMGAISKQLGKAVVFEHTAASAWKDIEAGDHIPVEHDWTLRMGKAGEKKGKVVIDGAGMMNTDRGKMIMSHGAKYSPVGNFFYLPDEAAVSQFLQRFPIVKEAAKGTEGVDFEPESESLLAGTSGTFTPAALNPARLQQSYAKLAEKLISEKLKIGDKYWNVKQYDPDVADTLHLVDNAPRYLREKAAANLKKVTEGLSEDQTRLAALMVDSDSRDDLERNHPTEFQQAQNDSAVMDAVTRFKPLQDELTADRQALGWPVRMSLHVEEDPTSANPFVVQDRDGNPVADFKTERQAEKFVEQNATVEPHLKRTYPEHSKSPLPADTGAGPSTGSFYADKGLRPPKMDKKSREMSADYHYQHGRKDFSGYLESYAQAKEAMLKQKLFDDFSDKATEWKQGTAQPPSIDYNGEKYYRPDLVLKAKQGKEALKPYAVYDPSRGERFLITNPSEGWATQTTGKPGIGPMDRYLAPKPVVDALENYDASRGGEGPGKLRKFLQEQIVGLFGPMVHVNNIIRHLGHGTGTGAFDPRSWSSITRVMLSGELRDRMMQGVDDSTIDMLVRRGAYTDWRDISNLNAYIGGNFNPMNWIRAFGKGVLFDPKFLGGWGGLDPKARVVLTDFLKEHAPGMSEQQMADAVNDAFGNYNRANWTERQKQIARFTLFPGWDTASAKWFLRHPFKVGVAGALVVLAANLVMHKLGLAKGDDWVDTAYLHWGDRKLRSGVVSDSIGQHIVQPALSAAEAAIKGEDIAEGATQGAVRGAAALAGQLAGPSVEMVADQLFNRKYAGGVSQIVEPEDKNIPGTWAPNREIEKRIAFAALKGLPALSRFINPKGQWDWKQGLGSAMGVTNYKYGAEERLKASVAKSMGYSQTLSVLAEREPEAAQKFVADPNKAGYLLFHNDLDQMAKDLKQIDKEKERVAMAGSLTQRERKEALGSLDGSRKQLLIAADALDDALTSAKLQMKQAAGQ